MAYKNASEKKQASLRRVTPKRLGDFPVGDLNLEQQRENLIAAIAATTDGHQKLELGLKISEINKQLNRFRWKNRNLGDLMLSVIKSETTKVQWKIWNKKAKDLADVRSKLSKEKIDELVESGSLDDYEKIMGKWKEMEKENEPL